MSRKTIANTVRYLSTVFSNNSEDEPTRRNPLEQALAELPEGAQIHLDFFGEPVTFLGVPKGNSTSTLRTTARPVPDIASAVACLDGFLIGVATKGKAFTGGGEEEGLSVQASHSAALAWAELLRHAAIWNSGSNNTTNPTKSTPVGAVMLSYVAVAPLLVQTGVGYVQHLDRILQHADTGVDGLPSISLLQLARDAASYRDRDDWYNPRERAHLRALHCLLQQDHRRAMMILQRHLQVSPGDALALSLVLDLAHTVGDSAVALRAATSVAAYWNERRGGLIRPSIPGYNTTQAMVALGLAVGGRHREAEVMAEASRSRGEKLAGGVATWALAHVLDAEGRTAEGISACSNTDGRANFESCGFILFDAILTGYGVRFALDREERGRGRSSALRLYDNNYESILEYSGFAQGQLFDKPFRKAPVGWRRSKFEDSNRAKAFIADVFGKSTPASSSSSSSSSSTSHDNIDADDKIDTGDAVIPIDGPSGSTSSLQRHDWKPNIDDVLTWLPPTPQFLSDATLLLLRLTLNGTISCNNYRWENLRNGWAVLIEMNRRNVADTTDDNGDDDGGSTSILARHHGFEFYPLVCVSASLMADPELVGQLPGAGGRLAAGLHKMGELLNLGTIAGPVGDENDDGDDDDEGRNDNEGGNFLSTILFRDIVADKEPNFWLPVEEESRREEWRTVLKLLSSAIDGVYDPTGEDDHDIMKAELSSGFQGWEFDVRPFLEHAVVYAACKCGDYESLSIARSICSRGVTLRPNSPEEWWRYSIVLGLLGDEVASEDALAASLAFGGGQGAKQHD